MRDDEVIGTLQQYFSKDGVMSYFGNTNTVRDINELFATTSPIRRNAPDLYFKRANEVFIVEHFEFDCYHRTGKGSKYRFEEARIQRAFDALSLMDNKAILRDVIKASSSYEDYIKNVKQSFDEHYAKINSYLQNLTNDGVVTDNTEVKIMFLIDDVSPLGTMMIKINDNREDNDIRPIELGVCKDFLAFLAERPKVNYVLACSSFGDAPSIWFINRDDLQEYYDNALDYSSMIFLPLTTNVIMEKFFIPDERLSDNSTVEKEKEE